MRQRTGSRRIPAWLPAAIIGALPLAAMAAGVPSPAAMGDAPSQVPPGSAFVPALLGMVLVYAVLGRPVWPAVTALRARSGEKRPREQPAITVTSCVVLRLLLGCILLAALRLPLATALASLIVLWATARQVAAEPGSLASPAAEAPSSEFATIVAAVINDTAAAAISVVALSLMALGDWLLLLAGVLVALVASLPAVTAARAALRRSANLRAATGGLLGFGVGLLAFSDRALEPISVAAGGVLRYIVALLFASIVIWRAGIERLGRA